MKGLSKMSRKEQPKSNEIDPARSAQMALIRGKDTRPELTVRRLLYPLGYRYRLHRRDLPGSPDIVFLRHRKAVFVHGCFWHMHDEPACWRSRLPKSRLDFWRPKLVGNTERDKRDQRTLREAGWDVLVVWECECAPDRRADLVSRLTQFLEKSKEPWRSDGSV